jgi:hypothetical protein
MQWMLVIGISIAGEPTYFEEFPVFKSLAECVAVTPAWMNVSIYGGKISLAMCQRTKTT